MTLTLTKHGAARINQRGLRKEDLDLVRQYGTPVPDRYGEVYWMRKKDIAKAIHDLKVEIQSLERLRGCTAVFEGDAVITAYWFNKKGSRALSRRRGRRS